MVATDDLELTSKLAPRLLASVSVALVVLSTEGASSLAEILLVAIVDNASMLEAEVSVLKLPFNARWVFADIRQVRCTQIVVNSSTWIVGLAFIAVHNGAFVVDAVINENSCYVRGPWIIATTNFALSMGWAVCIGRLLACRTHYSRSICMLALMSGAVLGISRVSVTFTLLPYTTLTITSPR